MMRAPADRSRKQPGEHDEDAKGFAGSARGGMARRSAVDADVRLYDRLFNAEEPGSSGDYRADLNPASLEVVRNCKVEPSLASVTPGSRFQFERIGYFCVGRDSTPSRPVFNRTVTLKDGWAKIQGRDTKN